MEKQENKNIKLNKIIIITFFFIIALSTLIRVLASVDVRKISKDGKEYVYFELQHSLSDAGYKYYGYGYTVSVVAPGGHVIATEYLENSEFSPFMDGNVEKVEISSRTLLEEKINIPEDYLSMRDLTIYLNARMGIKKDNVLTYAYDSYDGSSAPGMPYLDSGTVKLDSRTVPLNKDGKGIKNGIEHEYGISWSLATQFNLRQHFGIPITFDLPPIPWDRYKVEYREIGTDKTVSSEKPYQDFETSKTVTEYPESVNGYEYSGFYKIDKINSSNIKTAGNPIEGDSTTLNLKKNADRYIITFYYNKVDPSQIGKPVTVEIEYREDTSTGNKLLNNKTVIGGELSQFNLNCEKIDEYICKGYYVIGQATEYFYDTKASFIIGKENYSKPVNDKLKIIFIYEKIPYVSGPKCTPEVLGNSNTINITMKKIDFENATEININNANIKIDEFNSGKDSKGNIVEGSHGFNYFDVYIGNSNNYNFMSFDNKSKEIEASFIIPKNIFTKSTTDPNRYTTHIDILYAATCTCYDGRTDFDGDDGWAMDQGSILVNINLIENKPPSALFDYFTIKKIDMQEYGEIINKAYIGEEVTIRNKAHDPNGNEDISHIIYTLKDRNNKQYTVKILNIDGESYFLDTQNIDGENIKYLGVTNNGDLKLRFLTYETWMVSQYVEDIEALNDIYTSNITTEELILKPNAVIEDNINYRFPVTAPFNGKQNRVVMFNSKYSYVADYFNGTGIKINHNRDNWEIKSLNNQDLNTIYFDNNINSYIEDNVLKIKYQKLDDVKIMFKEPGDYLLRLQVSDTTGNVSEWVEKTVKVNNDLIPIVQANLSETVHRNSSGEAIMSINNILTYSNDDDIATLESIRYRYNTNNDGVNSNNFEDENWIDLGLNSTLKTRNLGKYQFEITVKESFGQETLDEYITNADYKRGKILLYTEVDNIDPKVTIFKIMTVE